MTQSNIRVVIVGGGTAGWMTASALASLLPAHCSVHLVESEEIGIVGVGEATLPHIRGFNETLGIDEAEFMAATRATFKLGILFENWGRVGTVYMNPFGTFGSGRSDFSFHQYWLRMRQEGAPVRELDAYSMACTMARLGRFTLPSQNPDEINSTFNYAYQFDSTQYGPFLRRYAEQLGANRTEGRIVDVELNGETGDIEAVVLTSGERIVGDLFVDCSGFASLLIGKALAEPWQDWSKWLPCDRAVAVPCRTATAVTPYTGVIAMDGGWRWRIPLQHRTGNGYVYSSAFMEDSAAAEALTQVIDGEPIAEPRLLRFRAGRRERSWIRNCVAIGLSSGFLEPLESTGIYLIQQAITALVELFPDKEIADSDRDEFNRVIDLEYDRVRDFLILHYHATERSDTDFWNYVRTMEIPDTLAEKLDLFRRRGRIVKYHEGVFLEASWVAVYLGQGVTPEGHDMLAEVPPRDLLAERMEELHQRIQSAAAAMPDHRSMLLQYCPMAA